MTLVSYILENNTTKELITTKDYSHIEKYKNEGFHLKSTKYEELSIYDNRYLGRAKYLEHMNKYYNRTVDKTGRVHWELKKKGV